MKRYLNENEKKTLYLYVSMTINYEKDINRLEKIQIKSDDVKFELKHLKLLNTYTKKLINHMLCDLDAISKKTVREQCGKYRLLITYDSDAKNEVKNCKKMEDDVVLKTDDVLAIIDHGLASCSVCNFMDGEEDKQVENCPIRKIWLKYDVAVLETDCGNGCPYRIKCDSKYQNYDIIE